MVEQSASGKGGGGMGGMGMKISVDADAWSRGLDETRSFMGSRMAWYRDAVRGAKTFMYKL